MILIADSGSTKTDWLLVEKGGDGDGARAMAPLHTQGINPFHQGADVIREILRSELLPQIEEEGARTHGATGVTTVRFYGSGVRPELEPVMAQLLSSTRFFTSAGEASVPNRPTPMDVGLSMTIFLMWWPCPSKMPA